MLLDELLNIIKSVLQHKVPDDRTGMAIDSQVYDCIIEDWDETKNRWDSLVSGCHIMVVQKGVVNESISQKVSTKIGGQYDFLENN